METAHLKDLSKLLLFAYMISTKWHRYGGRCHALSNKVEGAQSLSGRVLDSRPRGLGFEPHGCYCVVVFEQDTFILA